MTRKALCATFAAFGLLSLSAVGRSGADLGMWAMFRANEQGTGTLATRGVPTFHRVKWEFKAAGKITGSAVVGCDAVYFGDWGGTLYALDRSSGTLLWRADAGLLITSSPSLVDGVLYVTGADAIVRGFAAASGKKVWEFDTRLPGMGRPWMGVRSSPIVANGKLYVGNQHGRLMAIDLEKSTVIWDHVHRNWVLGSASIAHGLVFLGRMDDYIWAFDSSTGAVRWKFKTGAAVLSSPALADGLLYCGSDDNSLYALDALTGEEKWRFTTGGWVESSPAVAAGLVYFGSYDGTMYANNAKTGILHWRFRTNNHIYSSPAVVERAVYFGSYDGNLYAVDGQTGRELWRFKAEGGVLGSPAVVDGVVYFGSTGGRFYALE